MTNTVESIFISLGDEPAEALGFKTEEQVETALIPLMADVFHKKIISVYQESKKEEGSIGRRLN
tara:strand:- start:425 stop:616 length:192 start_codon:yes stop_codon:yes gene_type:complete